MGNLNSTAQVSQATPATQPTPAIKTTNKPTPPPRDRFISPGAGEKDVIQQLNKLEQIGPSTQGRVALTEIARKQWSNSPEFALAFLRAIYISEGLIDGWKDQPDREKFLRGLRSRMRQAILNLIPKNTPPPKVLDETHREILPLAHIPILNSYPLNLESENEGLIFINGIIRERPLYADILCRYIRFFSTTYKPFIRACWGDFSKKDPPVNLRLEDWVKEVKSKQGNFSNEFPYKKVPSSQLIPAGTGEKEIVQRLGSLQQEFGLINGREVLAEIAREHWSDSPEFASAFLKATGNFVHIPDLNDQLRRAILNLIPKDTPPPHDTLDYTHKLIYATIYRILMFLPNPQKSPDAVNFVRGLAQERPLYADHLCQATRGLLWKKANEPCW